MTKTFAEHKVLATDESISTHARPIVQSDNHDTESGDGFVRIQEFTFRLQPVIDIVSVLAAAFTEQLERPASDRVLEFVACAPRCCRLSRIARRAQLNDVVRSRFGFFAMGVLQSGDVGAPDTVHREGTSRPAQIHPGLQAL